MVIHLRKIHNFGEDNILCYKITACGGGDEDDNDDKNNRIVNLCKRKTGFEFCLGSTVKVLLVVSCGLQHICVLILNTNVLQINLSRK